MMVRDAVRGGRPAGVTPHDATADVGIYDHNAPRKEGTSSPTTEANGWVLAWSWVGSCEVLGDCHLGRYAKKCNKNAKKCKNICICQKKVVTLHRIWKWFQS